MEFRQNELEALLRDPTSAVNFPVLLDAMNAFMMDLDLPDLAKNKNVRIFLERYKKDMVIVRDLMMKKNDFEPLKLIGSGGFGEVQLVRHKENNRLYAMKLIHKHRMKKHTELALEERNFMVMCRNPWFVQLLYAFQDEENLYMVMDYMPGGDMATLIKKGTLTEEAVKFYAAELTLAVDAVHFMNYIHCDIKPRNILLDAKGHLRLADFGLCAKMCMEGQVQFTGTVGTCDYMAPEVVKSKESANTCGKEIDWWSVGVCIFEMLMGFKPFSHESESMTYNRILNHKDTLSFPKTVKISDAAKDIISSLLEDRNHRLGRGGISDVKRHPWFANTQWSFDTIMKVQAAYVPKLSDMDTRRYRDVKQKEPRSDMGSKIKQYEGNNLPFVGFTYLKKNRLLLDTPSMKESEELQRKVKVLEEQITKDKKIKENGKTLQDKYKTINKQLELITKKLDTERSVSAQLRKKEQEKSRMLQQAQTSLRIVKEQKLHTEMRLQAKAEAERQEILRLTKAISGLRAHISLLEVQVKQGRDTSIALSKALANNKILGKRMAELEKENNKMKSLAQKCKELELRLDRESAAKVAWPNQRNKIYDAKARGSVGMNSVRQKCETVSFMDESKMTLMSEKKSSSTDVEVTQKLKNLQQLLEEEQQLAHEVTKSLPSKISKEDMKADEQSCAEESKEQELRKDVLSASKASTCNIVKSHFTDRNEISKSK